MILPIVPYGDPILRKETIEIDKEFPYKELISDMFETMYNANGVGLAAPQIGKSIRVFIIDSSSFLGEEGIKRSFINPIIIDEYGKEWSVEEGCLSIPGVNGKVSRKENILIEYYNEDWELIEEEYSGYNARIIQHEYDHIEGVLFTDLLSPLKKKFISKNLNEISKGNIRPNYKMRF